MTDSEKLLEYLDRMYVMFAEKSRLDEELFDLGKKAADELSPVAEGEVVLAAPAGLSGEEKYMIVDGVKLSFARDKQPYWLMTGLIIKANGKPGSKRAVARKDVGHYDPPDKVPEMVMTPTSERREKSARKQAKSVQKIPKSKLRTKKGVLPIESPLYKPYIVPGKEPATQGDLHAFDYLEK